MRVCPSWYFLELLSKETWIILGYSISRWVTHGPVSSLPLMKVSQLQKMESIGLWLAFSRWSPSLPYWLPLAYGRDNIGQRENVPVTSKFAEESERWSGRNCALASGETQQLQEGIGDHQLQASHKWEEANWWHMVQGPIVLADETHYCSMHFWRTMWGVS